MLVVVLVLIPKKGGACPWPEWVLGPPRADTCVAVAPAAIVVVVDEIGVGDPKEMMLSMLMLALPIILSGLSPCTAGTTDVTFSGDASFSISS